jgi:hypothetical protein
MSIRANQAAAVAAAARALAAAEAQAIHGTFTTTYMTSGTAGATFAPTIQCKNCSSNYDAGRKGECNQWDNGVAGPAHVHHSDANKYCAPSNPSTFCPTIGKVVSGTWYGPSGSLLSSAGGNITLQCVYSSIFNPFDQNTINAFNGMGASDLKSSVGIQSQYCRQQVFSNISQGSSCATFYTNVTKDYDYQQVFRISEEHSDGSWATDNALLPLVVSVAQGTYGTLSTSLGRQTAQSLITTYCIVKNPSNWVNSTLLQQTINKWALQNDPSIGSDCQLLAADVIFSFCETNKTSSFCDCYNATSFGANIFTACQGNTSNACTDINKMAAAFSKAPSYFMPQIKALELYITPNCAVGACVDAIHNLNSKYLPPDTFQNLKCESNIQLCLASFQTGHNVEPGMPINQSCQASIGLPGSVPTSAGPSVSCSTPSANTPAPNRGFQNEQVVVTNANSPSTNFAVVAAPSGSTTSVATTGTPGGGLHQTVESNTPVSLQSSGPAPVTYTIVPSPSPVTAPAPVPATVPATVDYKVVAAGGGFLGLSSSLVFVFVCIILFILFSTGPRGA